MAADGPRTHISTATREDVFIRGKSLSRELIGQVSFTEAMFLQILGRTPSDAETRLLDACLVTLMEHGLTPTVVAARMTYTSAPESLQGAVAAGLASVGSLYVGTMEGCAALLVPLARIDDTEARRAEAARIVEDHRTRRAPLAGFGHPLHKPVDPRSVRLFELARELGLAGSHVEALHDLSDALDAATGRSIPINATGAIAAVLSDIDVPEGILRGFAVISRCAGLVGHIHEEQQSEAMHAFWQACETAVPYAEPE
jgi:citrate synthase